MAPSRFSLATTGSGKLAPGEKRFRQKRRERHDDADNSASKEDKQSRGDDRIPQAAYEQGKSGAAGRSAPERSERDSYLKHKDTSSQLRKLGLEARPLRFIRTVAQQLGYRVGAAGHPREACVEDIEQTAHSGEQENWRERHLDNVGNVLGCADFGHQRGGLKRVDYVATEVITSIRLGR